MHVGKFRIWNSVCEKMWIKLLGFAVPVNVGRFPSDAPFFWYFKLQFWIRYLKW